MLISGEHTADAGFARMQKLHRAVVVAVALRKCGGAEDEVFAADETRAPIYASIAQSCDAKCAAERQQKEVQFLHNVLTFR